MAAYKRPPLYKSERRSENSRHINNKQNPFSLSWQLQIEITKFTKAQEHSWNPSSIPASIQNHSHKIFEFIIGSDSQRQTEARCEWIRCNFKQFSENSWWIFITEPLRLQFEREHATEGSALQAWSQSLNQRRRRRGEEFHRIRTREEAKKRYRFIHEVRSQESKIRAKSKGTAKKWFESPIKTQVTSKLYFIPLEIITNSGWCESMEDWNCSAQNPNLNAKWFEKNKKTLQDPQRVWIGVNPWVLRKFHSEKTRKAKQFEPPDWDSRFVLIQRLKTISFDWFMLRMKARVD